MELDDKANNEPENNDNNTNERMDIEEKYDVAQGSLFEDLEHDWRKYWVGMPEFKQTDLMPYRTLYIHFECEDDVQEFAKLIEQSVYPKTKYVWFPEAEKAVVKSKRWVDGGQDA